MTEKSINQIIFNPDNMALTLIASVFLFLVLMLDTLVFRSSPFFYQVLFFSIEYTFLVFVVLLKNNIDNLIGFDQSLNKLFNDLRLKYSKSIFSSFSFWDWIILGIFAGLLLFSLCAFAQLGQMNVTSLNILLSGNLTSSEERFWELIRSESAPYTGMYLTISILILNFIREIIIDVKNRINNEKMNEKYDTIIKKLEEIQETQNKE